MSDRCFAKHGNACKALTVPCPGYTECPFYKPRWKQEEGIEKADARLRSLPFDKQEEIALKYYDGKKPWRGVYA